MRNDNKFDVYPLEGKAGICKTCGEKLEYREADRSTGHYQNLYRYTSDGVFKYVSKVCPNCEKNCLQI